MWSEGAEGGALEVGRAQVKSSEYVCVCVCVCGLPLIKSVSLQENIQYKRTFLSVSRIEFVGLGEWIIM